MSMRDLFSDAGVKKAKVRASVLTTAKKPAASKPKAETSSLATARAPAASSGGDSHSSASASQVRLPLAVWGVSVIIDIDHV